MTNQVTATWTGSAFMPDEAVPLAQDTRVRLTVETCEPWSQASAVKAWEAIKSDIKKRPLHFGGERLTRDEMHERG